jgi:hypothetical protein
LKRNYVKPPVARQSKKRGHEEIPCNPKGNLSRGMFGQKGRFVKAHLVVNVVYEIAAENSRDAKCCQRVGVSKSQEKLKRF